ncbi:MAG: AAA family ATPase [Porticoccaceae bacterium]
MKSRFATGLVVGKFCPLHKGHQHLIDAAVRSCDHLLVISYSKPEFDHCSRANRERWISQLYPTVTALVIDDQSLQRLCRVRRIEWRPLPHNAAPDLEHRDFVAWLCLTILGTQVDVVFTSEAYGDGFAGFLTEYFRSRGRLAADVTHVSVDLARNTVPVSGTVVRRDPFASRSLLAPVVYTDFVERVAILGGESSGKSTLAQALADHFETTWAREYGRELWQVRRGQLRREDMLEIATTQVDREFRLGLEARRFLFCDTTPLTTAFYSQAMFGQVDPRLDQLAARSYDHTILCAPDFEFVQDGTRRTEAFRTQQHEWYEHRLRSADAAFTLVSGSVENRLATVAALLNQGAATRSPLASG